MFPTSRGRIARPRSGVLTGRVNIPIGTIGREHRSCKQSLYSGRKVVLRFLFDVNNGGAIVQNRGEEGLNDIFDLDFAGENDGIVTWEGVRTKTTLLATLIRDEE
jgi:hypothetical protein